MLSLQYSSIKCSAVKLKYLWSCVLGSHKSATIVLHLKQINIEKCFPTVELNIVKPKGCCIQGLLNPRFVEGNCLRYEFVESKTIESKVHNTGASSYWSIGFHVKTEVCSILCRCWVPGPQEDPDQLPHGGQQPHLDPEQGHYSLQE